MARVGILAAVAVAALVVGYVLWPRDRTAPSPSTSSPAGSGGRGSAGSSSASGAGASATTGGPGPGAVGDPGRVRDPATAAGAAGTAGAPTGRPTGPRPATGTVHGVGEPVRIDPDGTRTYVMDNGTVVQDHRGDDFGPPIAPPPLPPSARTMNPQVTARIYQQLWPAVTTCAGKVPDGDRGDDPFVYVTMTVAVAGGKVTTTDVFPTLHDLKGDSVPGFTDCVRDAGMAVVVPDSGEPDRTDYIVQYPIRLR